MKKEKNLDELFRGKLLNYEQEPPEHLLENILAGATGRRRKRKLVFWRIAGVAAAILLAFIAGWELNDTTVTTGIQSVAVRQNSIPQTETKINDPIAAQASKEINEFQQTPNNGNKASHSVANTAMMANNSGASQEIKHAAEIPINVQANQSEIVSPLKSLTPLIKGSNQDALHLQESLVPIAKNEQEELSIDQQIMNQNKQMLTTQNETQKKNRWMVGAQISPSVNVNRSLHSQQYASNMVRSESGNAVNLGGGINVEYKPGKRWSIQSGVYYSGLGQTSGNSSSSNSNRYAMAPGDAQYFYNVNVDAKSNNILMNGTAGVIEFNGIPAGINLDTNLGGKSMTSAIVVSDLKFIQNFEYVEIPLYLRYTLLDSRFDLEVMGGFSSNLLVGNETYAENGNGKSLIGKTNDMVPVNYSGTLGLGLKYGLSKRIFLNVEPRVKYFLNSLNSNSSVTYKPYTIGVFTGLSYQF